MEEFLARNSKLLIFSLIGLILIGFGVLSYKTSLFSSGDKVEVLSSTKAGPDSHQDIIVEIAGAVEKPGVYKFNKDARIDDLLISAGGISGRADRVWVEKFVNRAAKLIDGQKIYIYSLSETKYHSEEVTANNNGGYPPAGGQVILGQQVTGDSVQGLVNINTASLSELDTLPGIGPVYAQKIIDGRMYSNVEELVSKKIIPQKTFEKIKNAISVY